MTPTKEFNLEIIQNLEQNVLEITTEQEFQWQQLENVKGQIRENRDKIEIEMLCYNEKLRLEMEFNISEDLHFLSLLLDRYETLLKKCKRTKRIWRRMLQQQVRQKKKKKMLIQQITIYSHY